MVLGKYLGSSTKQIVDNQIASLGISVISFTAHHVDIATKAFEEYGKGRHPAALNFGDCMVYALAKASASPLLFTGDDFSRTDVDIA